MLKVWGEVGVVVAEVGDDEAASRKARLDECQDLQVEVVAAVEEQQIDVLAEVPQRLQVPCEAPNSTIRCGGRLIASRWISAPTSRDIASGGVSP